MTFPTGVAEIRKCSDEELKTMLDEAREASKHSRRLGRVMGIVAAHRIQQMKAVELAHLVVKWSAVRNQLEIETSLKMRGMSSFLFVKLVQQRRTENHAKPAHRVRRSSGQPFTGTTRSAGVGGVRLALSILVGLAKKWCCAAFLYISCQPFFTT